jgi:chemotaxis protein MotB
VKVAETKITDFKSQVASLIAERLELNENLKLEREKTSKEISSREAAELALAAARDTISQKISKEQMMAASNEALEQLVKKLKLENRSLENLTAEKETELSMVKEKMESISKDLTDAEKLRVMEQYAIRELQKDLMEKQEEVSTFPEDEQMTESKYRLVKNSKLAKKASWKRIAPAQMTAQRKEESYIRKRKSLEDEAENCGA